MPSEATKDALYLRSNQQFLFKLFQLKKRQNHKRYELFKEATDTQIAIVIKVIRLIWTGEIPLKKLHYEEIKRAKKIAHISKHFLREDDYKNLKTVPISKQKEILCKISNWHELLYNLFKKPRTT